eukprot:gene13115-biopygen12530
MAAGADRTRTGRTITFKETDAGQTRAASFLPTVDEGAKRMGGVAEPPNPSKQGPRLAQPRLDIEGEVRRRRHRTPGCGGAGGAAGAGASMAAPQAPLKGENTGRTQSHA